MKVYLICRTWYDDFEVKMVYATREQAEQHLNNLPNLSRKGDWWEESGLNHAAWSVEEHEVQGAS